MNQQQFDEIVERRITLIRAVLKTKGKEYADDDDRLSGVRRQAEMERKTPSEIIQTLMGKHWTSVMRMIESKRHYPRAVWDEKLGDIINYCIIIEAIEQDSSLGD